MGRMGERNESNRADWLRFRNTLLRLNNVAFWVCFLRLGGGVDGGIDDLEDC